MLIGEATSQQIKSGIKKNSFVWENKGQITQDHKKCFYGLIWSTDFFCVSNSSDAFLFFQLQFGLQYRRLKEVSTFLFPLHFS